MFRNVVRQHRPTKLNLPKRHQQFATDPAMIKTTKMLPYPLPSNGSPKIEFDRSNYCVSPINPCPKTDASSMAYQVCEVSWGRVQGLRLNVEQYRSTWRTLTQVWFK
eukprot:Filipodium_phascolosomae@DN2390_c0_g1_i5.p1